MTRSAIVVGGGPAGLMAAETLAQSGARVDVFDAMPSVGRKFLLAGKGGLNLTHSEPFDAFASRFGARRPQIEPLLRAFDAGALRQWAGGLGVTTFVGSSGRVFPLDMKAAPLLRAWLHRLRGQGVRFHMRHRWVGWGDDGAGLRFATPAGDHVARAPAVVLALGGASWPRLGSDGAWLPLLRDRGVPVRELLPSNCGFDVALPHGWSEFFRDRFAGQPLKNVALSFDGADGTRLHQQGEFIVTEGGVEGSLVYAASGALRDTIAATGVALAHIDLLPQRSAGFVAAEVARPRGSRSLSTHLKTRLGIEGVKAALLRELLPREVFNDAASLAGAIKALPLPLARPRPVAEAISSAGGVPFEALDDGLMLRALPGVFVAGEMLDWEAPTGGYLLTACFATGRAAGAAASMR
ncbi:TIGR03862 family flavoprotein [Piscinibacter sp. XHJ-5]|uniref:TIGR03862 family flavoprotein n=1 Tax=Piscinibacter sp. XHJ-5 TaxID=3037797 RepID=UPI002452FF2A|nr:TIGR03862 family flavoprotein [Piscinibacter sp. XHJ-5]